MLYYPCFECQNKYGRQYSAECDGQCDYAIAVKEKKELEEKNNRLNEILLEYRICPKCGEQMAFHIEGNFGGTLGIFDCSCGYRNGDYSNFLYATEDELNEFYENTKDIMW